MEHRYTITPAASAVGIATATLRAYEMRGVVAPLRDSSGRRLYSDTDIEHAKAYRAKTAQRGAPR
jgi:MerR family transcriptional regulator/heat shock protein HspR